MPAHSGLFLVDQISPGHARRHQAGEAPAHQIPGRAQRRHGRGGGDRNGPTGKANLLFLKQYARFENGRSI